MDGRTDRQTARIAMPCLADVLIGFPWSLKLPEFNGSIFKDLENPQKWPGVLEVFQVAVAGICKQIKMRKNINIV